MIRISYKFGFRNISGLSKQKKERVKCKKMESTCFDVTHSIFDNETAETLYVVRDVYAADTVFVFALQGHSYSLVIREEHYEFDLEQGFKYESLFQPDRKEKFKAEMRRIIENWHEL